MTKAGSESAPAAPDLIGRSSQRWHEFTAWLANNESDIALGALAAALIALVLVALRRWGHRLIREKGTLDWRMIAGRALARTSLIFIAAVAVKSVSAVANAPWFLQRGIDIVFTIGAALQAAIWGREIVLGLIEQRVEEEEPGRLASAIGIIRLLVTVSLLLIAFIVILDNLDVDVTALVAGLGIGGIAIGLAAQGIFSDLFAALSIIFDRPFRRGDTITFGQPPATGMVEHIGLKTTRIRSLDGEEVAVGNAKLLEQPLQNWTMLSARRALLQIGLVYQTPPELLARVPGELQAIVEAQDKARFDRAHAVRFAPSSIDFELVFHVDSSDFIEFAGVRQAVMLAILSRFAELGISFAYPTQTTFTAAPDGTLVMPYAEPKNR